MTDEALADEADNPSPASEQSCWESPESSSGENKSGRSTYQPSAKSAESDDLKSLLRYLFMLAISLYIRFAAPASPEAIPASERPQCLEASALTTWLRIRLRLTLRARFAAHALPHQPPVHPFATHSLIRSSRHNRFTTPALQHPGHSWPYVLSAS